MIRAKDVEQKHISAHMAKNEWEEWVLPEIKRLGLDNSKFVRQCIYEHLINISPIDEDTKREIDKRLYK